MPFAIDGHEAARYERGRLRSRTFELPGDEQIESRTLVVLDRE
jgi:hypothetical protein